MEELFWAAGFIDGEGNIRWNKNKIPKEGNRTRAYGSPVLQVAQIDRLVLERLQKALGVGRIYGPYEAKGNRQPYYQYAAVGKYCLEAFNKVKDILSPVKARQGLETIEKYNEQNNRPKLDTRFKKKPKNIAL